MMLFLMRCIICVHCSNMNYWTTEIIIYLHLEFRILTNYRTFLFDNLFLPYILHLKNKTNVLVVNFIHTDYVSFSNLTLCCPSQLLQHTILLPCPCFTCIHVDSTDIKVNHWCVPSHILISSGKWKRENNIHTYISPFFST